MPHQSNESTQNAPGDNSLGGLCYAMHPICAQRMMVVFKSSTETILGTLTDFGEIGGDSMNQYVHGQS